MLCASFRVNPCSIVCLNVKELLAWSRPHIWNLTDSREIRTQNHLAGKWILNHLAKLVCLLVFIHQLSGCGFASCCCHLNQFKVRRKFNVRRINLKWILLNKLKWILDKLQGFLCGQCQPMQLYLNVCFSFPAQASCFLICAGDSVHLSYCLHVIPRLTCIPWHISVTF